MLVLLIDLGLAAAGVVLLREGLREVPVTNGSGSGSNTAAGAQVEPAKPPQTDVVANAPPPPPAPDAAPAPTPSEGSAAPPPEPPPPPPTSSGGNRARNTKIHVTSRRPGGGSSAGSGPVDPYAGEPEPAVTVATQVDRLFAHGKPAFDGCYTTIMKSMPPDPALHGTIKVAFRVSPEGHIERVIAVENGTGSEPLAGCLITEIGSWALPAHPGDAVDFVRAVTF